MKWKKSSKARETGITGKVIHTHFLSMFERTEDMINNMWKQAISFT